MILNLCYYSDVLGVGALTNHLSKHHNDVWQPYVLKRNAKKTAVENAKKSEQSNCEMENAAVRFTNMRSNAGQLTFLNQVFVQCASLSCRLIILPSSSLMCPRHQPTGLMMTQDL